MSLLTLSHCSFPALGLEHHSRCIKISSKVETEGWGKLVPARVFRRQEGTGKVSLMGLRVSHFLDQPPHPRIPLYYPR